MSVQSDDTDVLLLIPPDFFLVPSDSEDGPPGKNKNVEESLISDLISQVNDLEGRISLIENHGLRNNRRMASVDNLQRLKHFGSTSTLNACSTFKYSSKSLQSTPVKTQTLPVNWNFGRTEKILSPSKHRKNSSKQENLLMSNEYIKQKEKDEIALMEINNFFKERGTNGTTNFIDLSSNDSSTDAHLSAAVSNMNKVNDLLNQLEDTQAEIEQKLRSQGFSRENASSNYCDSQQKEQPNLNKSVAEENSETELSPEKNKSSKRQLQFDEISPVKSTNISYLNLEKKKDDSVTINDQTESDFHLPNKDGENDFDIEKMKTCYKLTEHLSLNKLWGNHNTNNFRLQYSSSGSDINSLREKYQEEQCRRHHCEHFIQELQIQLLEQQQKVAVAMKVDEEKDEAISKLSEACNKLLNHSKKIEKQNQIFAKTLESEREKFELEMSAVQETVKSYETELSKALNLAHDYKEKCEILEKDKRNLNANAAEETKTLKRELKNIQETLQNEKIRRDDLEKSFSAKVDELCETKAKISEFQIQVQRYAKNLKDRESELRTMRAEKEKLCGKLQDERNRVSTLEQSKKILMQSNEDLKKKEKSLKDSIKIMSEQVDKVKVELKEFYQGQVEQIVQEKLREFQEQLTAAEKTLQKEMEERERKMTEMAVEQVQRIAEKHKTEVNILEEKHRQEIELWKIKVFRSDERIKELEKKLEYHSSQKAEMARKLQSMMEAQWQEALKIIASTASPQITKSAMRDNQSYSDKTKDFRLNVFDIIPFGSENLNFSIDKENQNVASFKDVAIHQQRIKETPEKLASHGIGEDPLKKYIQELLERRPGLPMDEALDKSTEGFSFDTSNILQWQQILAECSSRNGPKN